MSSHRKSLAFALASCVALAELATAPARAANDPTIEWHTLETPHFRVSYYTGEEETARRVADLCESIFATLVPAVGWPPSERVDNLWEYLRISAEDAGVVPAPSDSVEDFLGRIKGSRPLTPELLQAAAIYEETRYGFVVKPGAPKLMKAHSLTAASSLTSDMTKWDHVKSWWRPLS